VGKYSGNKAYVECFKERWVEMDGSCFEKRQKQLGEKSDGDNIEESRSRGRPRKTWINAVE